MTVECAHVQIFVIFAQRAEKLVGAERCRGGNEKSAHAVSREKKGDSPEIRPLAAPAGAESALAYVRGGGLAEQKAQRVTDQPNSGARRVIGLGGPCSASLVLCAAAARSPLRPASYLSK